MNKAGKISLFVVALIFASTIILLASSTFAILEKERYSLGDNVKIDLTEISDYELRLTTPSNVYRMSGSEETISIRAEEVGTYNIYVKSADFEEEYEFLVVGNYEAPPNDIVDDFIEANSTNVSEMSNSSLEEVIFPEASESIEEESEHFTKWDGIVIGKPVKNKEVFDLEPGQERVRIRVPVVADDVKVYDGENLQEIEAIVSEDVFSNTVSRIFSDGSSETSSIRVNNPSDKIVVEYETPPALADEREISPMRKEVVISSHPSVHYNDVMAYSDLPMEVSDLGEISLFWREENRFLSFEAYDSDSNGLFDRIEWIVPHLSNQTFEIAIEVLTVQSYPTVGGNWEVRFNTVGQGDLYITGFNGTSFGDDLDFLELRCGQEAVNYSLIENGIFVSNYSCSQESSERSRVISEGKHALEFRFGNRKEYAYNFASRWFNSSWDFRREIVVNSTRISESVTDFPMLVSMFDSHLRTNAQADGDDILFTLSDGYTQLSHEIEIFNQTYNSTDAQLVAWVKLNLSSTSDTRIFMYYNNTAASNQENSSDVWSNNYEVVYHLSDGGTGTRVDSTSYSRNGTTSGYDGDESTTGKIGIADNFDGSNDNFEVTGYTGVNGTNPRTVELWFQSDGTGGTYRMVSWGDNNNGEKYDFRSDSSNGDSLRIENAGGQKYGSTDIVDQNWHYLAVTFENDGTPDVQDHDLYVNGLLETSTGGGSQSLDTSTANNVLIGESIFHGNNVDGTLDEIRISSVARSAGWLNVSYQNQDNPSSFMTFNEPEQPRLGIIINSPADGSTVADPTPPFEVSITGLQNAQAAWYTTDGGLSNFSLCDDCTGTQTGFLFLAEGDYTLTVYANNSNGTGIFEESDFTVFLNNYFFDDYDDNSSISTLNDVAWGVGNVSFEGSGFSGGQKIFIEENGFVVIEAENFTNIINRSGKYWQSETTDAGFSGTEYLTALTDSGTNNNVNYDTLSPELQFSVDFSTAGTYYVWVHGYGPSGGSDSIHAGINGTTPSTADRISSFSASWSWSRATMDPADATMDIYEGLNQTVNFWMREDGMQFDKFILTTNASYTPTGTGPAESEVRVGNNKGNFTSYIVNVTNTITQIDNITWNEFGTDEQNNITIEISADNGGNWIAASSGESLSLAQSGSSLVYRALFQTNQSVNISILDMNITWSNVTTPAPNITIHSPAQGSTIADVTPLLNITLSDPAQSVWYTTNDGVTNITLCSFCNGNQDGFLFLEEREYNLTVYANNSLGEDSYNTSSFTIDMDFHFYDSFDDNSSIVDLNNVLWNEGNITLVAQSGASLLLNETFEDTNNWTLTGGSWSISSNQLIQSGNVDGTYAIYDLIDMVAGKDYNISMTAYDDDNDESGIIFRYQDVNNYYRCTANNDGGIGTTGTVLYRVEGASENTLASDSSSYVENSQNDYTVTIIDNNISCYRNGQLIISAVDSTWEDGQVGIFNRYHQNALYDNYTVYDITPISSNFTSYPINTSSSIVEILNITWTESGSDSLNNVSLEISPDNGQSWYAASNGEGIVEVASGSSLVYRAFFNSDNPSISNITLLDVNITWTDQSSPPPAITIYSPLDGSTVEDVTPILNVSLAGTAQELWYTTNGGITNVTVCEDCAGEQSAFIYLSEGTHTVDIYTDNLVGDVATNSTTFTVDMNYHYYDSFDDNSSLDIIRNITWQIGNVSLLSAKVTADTYNGIEIGYTDGNLNFIPNQWNGGGNAGEIDIECPGGDASCYFVMQNGTNITGFDISNGVALTDSGSEVGFIMYSVEDVHTRLSPAPLGAQADNFVGVCYVAGQWYYDDNNGCNEGPFTPRASDVLIANYTGSVSEVSANNESIPIAGGVGNFTSYPINTSSSIVEILNVTWNEADTNENNTILVQVSANNGQNWYNATSGQGVSNIEAGTALTYRVLYDLTDLLSISLLDMNITWSDQTLPAPNITIYSPVNGSTIADVTPTLNISVETQAKELWYSIDGGITNTTICTFCSGTFSTYLYLSEGSYTVDVYSSNSVDELSSNSTSFTIDLDKNFFDTYLDNSSLVEVNDVFWQSGNITFNSSLGSVIVFSETFNDGDHTDGSPYTWVEIDNGASCTWSVVSGVLTESSNCNDGDRDGDSLAGHIYPTDSSGNNLSFSDFNLTSQIRASDDDGIGILFRYQNASNYYRLKFMDQGSNYRRLEVFENGVRTILDSDSVSFGGLTQNSWHNVTITAQGSSIEVFLDGVSVLNATDTTHSSGNIAAWAWGMNSGSVGADFDWFTVEDLAASASGNFTAYSINTTQPINRIQNITWSEDGTDGSTKNISVQLSFDQGSTWYDVVSGQGLTGFTGSSTMLFRTLFIKDDESILTLFDTNISWTEPPLVDITYPIDSTLYGSNVTLLNYTVQVGSGLSLDTCWYTLDSGVTNTSITCGTNATGISSNEGNNTWIVYANDSEGAIGTDSVFFEVDTAAPSINFINQTDELGEIVNESNPLNEGENLTVFVEVDDENVDSVWIVVWETVKGGVEKARIFFENVAGNLWMAVIPTDITWTSLYYDYTIYANDTTNATSEYDGNFTLLKLNSTISLNPNPSNGTGSVTATGQINFTNGSYFANRPINLWLDGELLLLSNLTVPSASESAPWWNSSWSYRRDITISNAGTSTLTDYPVYINVSKLSAMENDFFDLRFINGTCSSSQSLELSYEIENYTSTSAHVWVKLPYLPASGSTVCMYYGNSAADSGENPSDVWSNNYQLVYHFNEPGTGDRVDSTQNSRNGSTNNYEGDEKSSGIIGFADNLDGTDDTISVTGYTGVTGTDARTVEVWYQSDVAGGENHRIVSWGSGSSGAKYDFRTDSSNGNSLRIENQGGQKYGSTDVMDLNWNYLVVTFEDDGTPDVQDHDLYVNGLLETSTGGSSQSLNTASSADILIGESNFNAEPTDGTIDELRISNVSRSQDWINQTYQLVQNQASYVSFGSEEVPNPYGNYDVYQEFTDTDSNDFNSGSFYQTVGGDNITLSSGNVSGNFTKVLDAGARVEWNSVSWVHVGQSCAATVSYQEGANGYSGTRDTYIDSGNPNDNYGTDLDLQLDTSPSTFRTLLKFDNVFGPGGRRIPYNSTITSANVTVDVYDDGNPVSVYQVLENWTESEATYNNRISATSWSVSGCSTSPCRSTSLQDSFNPSSIGSYTFDITELLTQWNNHSSENYGVILNPGGSGGVGIRSSEYGTQSSRPQLNVQFSSSDCTSSVIFVRTSNDKSSWTSWQQVSSGGEISDSNIASRYLEYRVELGGLNETVVPAVEEIVVNYTAVVTNSTGGYEYAFSSPTTFGTYPVVMNTSYLTIFTEASEDLSVQAGVTPSVILVNPDNSTWHSSINVTFTYNVTDLNSDFANSTLILGGVENLTNGTAIVNGGDNTFEQNFSSGEYYWTVEVRDLTNNLGTAETRTFYVDLIDPYVELFYPANSSVQNVNELNLSFRPIDNLDTTLSCDIYLDDSTVQTGLAVSNGSIVNVSSGTISGGQHFWNVTCIDEAGRQNTSLTWDFTVSNSPPDVSLVWPATSYLDSDGNISFVFNASDDFGFANATLVINGTFDTLNQTVVNNGENTTINRTGLPEGQYNWTVFVSDVGGITAEASPVRTFTVDLFAPSLYLNLPANDTTSSTSTVSFNFTVNDTIDSSLTCDLIIDEIVQDNDFAATSGSLTNRILSDLTDGQKIWSIECFDDAGHTNTSIGRTITIAEPPTVYLNTSNETAFSSSLISLDYTPLDNSNVASCDLYLNGAFNQSNASTITNGALSSFSIDGIADGSYNWFVNCTDGIGESALSEERLFFIDSNGPIVLLHDPNAEDVFASNITFNFTATDSIDTSLLCDITVDTTVVSVNVTSPNGTATQDIVSGITDGFHTWNVTCIDDAGNLGYSTDYNFTKFTNPGITLVSPDDGAWINTSEFNVTYVPADDEGVLQSLLIINGFVNATNTTTIINEAQNNFTISGFPDGFYNWTVNITDITGLNGSAEQRQFYIDTISPNVTLNYPNDSLGIIATNNISFNYTVFDNLDTSIFCNVTLDGDVEFSENIVNGSDSVNSLLVVDGNHTWSVSCFDNADNANIYEEVNFTIEAPPNVTLDSPEDNYWSNSSSVTFVYTPLDPIGINECSIYLDGSLNDTDNSISANNPNNFTINGISQGYHNWTVSCIDPDLNEFQPLNRTVIVDTEFPEISLVLPPNNTNTLSTTLFNFTTTDNLDMTLTCDLYIDGSLNISSISVNSSDYYSESVTGLSLGQHLWNVTCVDNANNTNWSDTWLFNVTRPDLFINVSDIHFNTTSPTENESVMINATVHNLVSVLVEDIVVQFYDGDPDVNGIQIGSNQTISSIGSFGQANASIIWNSDLGTSQIYVLVDPPIASGGLIVEWDETNNEANKSISVGAWHFLLGDINSLSAFELSENSSGSDLVQWESVNYAGGNLFVADSESQISWTNLQAMGKTVADSDSLDDFSDVDTLLNMTGYADSVSALYLNSSGGVLNQSTYLIFQNYIDEVPVTNSTNITEFTTGILWDTSDDGDGEFDTSDKEDLIFITSILRDQAGAYGVYDYEIRIPARLREYYTTESRRVVFYTELR